MHKEVFDVQICFSHQVHVLGYLKTASDLTRTREYSCENLKKKNFILNQTSNKTKETNFAGIMRKKSVPPVSAINCRLESLCITRRTSPHLYCIAEVFLSR